MSLNLAFCPSIHPHASAPSSASAYVSDVEPDSFFAIFSHNPRDEAWWVANHSDQALAVANESAGRSSAAVSTCPYSSDLYEMIAGRIGRSISSIQSLRTSGRQVF